MNGRPAPSLTRGSAYDERQRLLGDRKPLTPEADSYPETAPRRFSYGLTPNSEPPSLDRSSDHDSSQREMTQSGFRDESHETPPPSTHLPFPF
ncbi:hypothetical protein PAL_GLEAN10015306 [Pteropus alecto]|uniref:Uncharacterized protein n=1 Tax=Pteropus alecto TaxID=9402 RepID=L5KFE4_PTEAL|nr:hypothetical protein PAL_GLEAN10015306 [Pteropus alecto]